MLIVHLIIGVGGAAASVQQQSFSCTKVLMQFGREGLLMLLCVSEQQKLNSFQPDARL